MHNETFHPSQHLVKQHKTELLIPIPEHALFGKKLFIYREGENWKNLNKIQSSRKSG